MVTWDKLHQDLERCKPSTAAEKIDLLEVDLQLLAEQMTQVEQRFFEAISIPDLIKQAWVTNQASPLALWVSHSNAVSRWVASRILQTTDRKDRGKLIARMIKLASLLHDLNNYSGMISIYLALAMDCIGKLSKTWSAGAGSLINQFTRLSETIRPLHNFSGYRDDLKKAVAPGIPYMAVLMKDMVTMEELVSTSFSKGLAHPGFDVGHLETVMNILQSQLTRFRKAKYHFDVDQKLFPELFNPAAFDLIAEEELDYHASLVEKDKSKRETQRLPPIALNISTANDAELPALFGMMSPKNSPTYGLRYQQRSEPGTPTSSREFDLSSPQHTIWRNHTTFCMTSLQEVSHRQLLRRDSKPIPAFSELGDRYSANLAVDRSPVKPNSARGRRVSVDDDTAPLDPIQTFVESIGFIIPLVKSLAFRWIFDPIPATHHQVAITHSKSILLQSIALEILLSAVKTMACYTANPVSGKGYWNLKEAGGDSPSTVSFIFTIVFVAEGSLDASAGESAVLSLLSPSSSKRFVTQSGRFSIVNKGSNRYEASVQLSAAVKSLAITGSPMQSLPRARTAFL